MRNILKHYYNPIHYKKIYNKKIKKQFNLYLISLL